jgi:hypothetical protein
MQMPTRRNQKTTKKKHSPTQPPSVVRKLQKDQVAPEKVEHLFEKEQLAPGQMQGPPPERHQQKEKVAPATGKLQSLPSEGQHLVAEKVDLVIEKEQQASAAIDHSIEKEKSERPLSHPNPHLTTPMRSLPSTTRCATPLAKATAPQNYQDNQSRKACQQSPVYQLIETEATIVDHTGHVRKASDKNPASQFEHSRAYVNFLIYDPDLGVYKITTAADVACKLAPDNTTCYHEEGFREVNMFEEIQILESMGACKDALCPQKTHTTRRITLHWQERRCSESSDSPLGPRRIDDQSVVWAAINKKQQLTALLQTYLTYHGLLSKLSCSSWIQSTT